MMEEQEIACGICPAEQVLRCRTYWDRHAEKCEILPEEIANNLEFRLRDYHEDKLAAYAENVDWHDGLAVIVYPIYVLRKLAVMESHCSWEEEMKLCRHDKRLKQYYTLETGYARTVSWLDKQANIRDVLVLHGPARSLMHY